MTPLLPTSGAGPGFVALLLVLGLIWRCSRRSPSGDCIKPARKGFVEIRPNCRSFLRLLGLTEADHFLSLPAQIISGHPDRNVARVVLGSGSAAVVAYLKREHCVSWLVRLRNALAGFGLVSRSLRECRLLQALQREGLPCPEWLAAGEDGHGRAFLLVRQTESVDLRAHLAGTRLPADRRWLAQSLGAALARLHHAGFTHPDLYAKHVLLRAGDGLTHPFNEPARNPSWSTTTGFEAVVLLDWQRARRRHAIGWRQRGLDLAALHATLPGQLASVRDRLRCLRAYLAEMRRLAARADLPPRRGGLFAQPGTRRLLAGLHAGFRRRVRLRHIREKCQPVLGGEEQDWLCLNGEALCVTSALARVWPGRSPEWLGLDRQPIMAGKTVTHRYLPVAGQQRALLVRRRAPARDGLWNWLRRRLWSSPEQRLSVVLLRLQRHGIAAPRVLAMGQRQAGRGRDSFLLTEAPERTLRLDLWLRRQAEKPPVAERALRRQRALWEAGALLARLQRACCYLRGPADAALFAVRVGTPADAQVRESHLVLNRVDWICPSRSPRPGQARRGYEQLRRALRQAGMSAAEMEFFHAGYCRQRFGLADAVPIPTEANACPA